MAIFTIENLTFTYPKKVKPAYENINLEIMSGEFITVCGKSGCGKTTFLRSLKTVLKPYGEETGDIYFQGNSLDELGLREQASKIGFVLQNPDGQIVTDKVWHELAFGLESLGFDSKTIRIRVAEMASFFGIQEWFLKDVAELSGGQKQLLNLASIMTMQPEVLILDEPTAQLDPIAAGDFLDMVKKINRDIGTTVIISEHRLEEVLPMSDRVVVMDRGKVIVDDSPANAGAILSALDHEMFAAMPAPLQIYGEMFKEGIGKDLPCPIDVRSGRQWLSALYNEAEIKTNRLDFQEVVMDDEDVCIETKSLSFKYEGTENKVLKDLNLKVKKGELFCFVGGNGAGKTTLLKLLSGINKPNSGEIFINGKNLKGHTKNNMFSGLLGVLPQNPQAIFVKNTLEKDLYEILHNMKDEQGEKITDDEKSKRVKEISILVEIDHLMDMHPYDLSGGEQQKAALAKILLLKPRILLLDEPTKGLDNNFKSKLAVILKKLTEQGTTVLMVSHDVEFCAGFGDRCGMLFDGNIVAIDNAKAFFADNSFYTTAANRMSRHIFNNAVTKDDVVYLCKENKDKLKVTARPQEVLREVYSKNSENSSIEKHSKLKIPEENLSNGGLNKQILSWIVLALFPVTLFAGIFLLNDRQYLFVSFVLVIYAMIPFFIMFEKRKPQTREIIVISVLTAIAVMGKAAFFMVPSFKPVTALVIISGISMGPQTGFLVGALSGFISNFLFGQGPWTPWQMFSYGIIGFIAGFLAQKKWLSTKKISLGIFGAIMAFFVYGGIVDLWTIFGFYSEPDLKVALTIYGLALPFNIIHGVATAIFLYFFSEPMLEKLNRIKVKYGLLR